MLPIPFSRKAISLRRTWSSCIGRIRWIKAGQINGFYKFKEKVEFFITKTVLYNKADECIIYSFEKPNAEGKLEFVIDKNTEQKDFDTILTYVAMLSSDGKYYKKIILISVDWGSRFLRRQ